MVVGEALITAAHGNVEQMEDVMTGQAHTAHTCKPVPFIYVGKRDLKSREGGVRGDVAPTMLTLLGLPVPAELSGRSLVGSNQVRYPEAGIESWQHAYFRRRLSSFQPAFYAYYGDSRISGLSITCLVSSSYSRLPACSARSWPTSAPKHASRSKPPARTSPSCRSCSNR